MAEFLTNITLNCHPLAPLQNAPYSLDVGELHLVSTRPADSRACRLVTWTVIVPERATDQPMRFPEGDVSPPRCCDGWVWWRQPAALLWRLSLVTSAPALLWRLSLVTSARRAAVTAEFGDVSSLAAVTAEFGDVSSLAAVTAEFGDVSSLAAVTAEFGDVSSLAAVTAESGDVSLSSVLRDDRRPSPHQSAQSSDIHTYIHTYTYTFIF